MVLSLAMPAYFFAPYGNKELRLLLLSVDNSRHSLSFSCTANYNAHVKLVPVKYRSNDACSGMIRRHELAHAKLRRGY